MRRVLAHALCATTLAQHLVQFRAIGYGNLYHFYLRGRADSHDR
jgi:hypothetical protein